MGTPSGHSVHSNIPWPVSWPQSWPWPKFWRLEGIPTFCHTQLCDPDLVFSADSNVLPGESSYVNYSLENLLKICKTCLEVQAQQEWFNISLGMGGKF